MAGSNFTGQTMAFPGGTADTFTTPYPVRLGTRAQDASGNIFVLCNVGSNTIVPELAVVIESDWTISPLTAGNRRGSVGVVADLTKASLTSAPVSPYPASTAVWVQIYGRCYVQCSTGGDSSPSEAITTLSTTAMPRFRPVTTGASTPAGALLISTDNVLTTVGLIAFIRGMTVAHDATVGDVSAVTLVSATHSGARAAVWLNFPDIAPVLSIPSAT